MARPEGGGRKPNNWGINDMHGSVREWCADWWGEDYYRRSPLVDPQGPPTGNYKVIRGGAVKSYGRFAIGLSIVHASGHPGHGDGLHVGARLVINLP